jgi:uncharacterized membrane protein
MPGGDTDTEAARDAGRLEAFSDGVFAIAITLLVLDIHAPRGAHGEPALWRALLALWPNYFSYAVSFLVIGSIWANHHTMFRHIRCVDRTLLWLNTLLLLNVAFFPFAASLLAEYIATPDARVGALVYSGTLTVGGVLFNLLWGYAARDHRLLAAGSDSARIRRISRRWRAGPLLYGLAFAVAWVSPTASLILFAALILLYALAPEWRPPGGRGAE